MNTPPDFSKYTKQLNIEQLKKQGTQALADELSYTRQLYESLDTIFQDSLDGFFITDGEGNVLKVNKSYEEMSGITSEEIIGQNMHDLESTLINYSASLIVLKTRQTATIEQSFLRTGRKAYITSTPVFSPEGKIIMVISNTRDFKMIEELRQQLSEQMVQVSESKEKIRALTQQNIDRSQFLVNDPKMYEILYSATKVADKDTTVLIQGETGTGKELLAHFIHQNSSRRDNPMLSVNCGAIAKDLIESELFGYEGGAFTGALSKGRPGYFEVANGGTLFLDEIGEMPMNVQMKLLRALQENEIMRLGSSQPRKIDVRVIAATNRDLKEMIDANEFRSDLYYRLNVVNLEIPPLRERKKDIIPLAQHFLNQFNAKFKTHKTLSPYSCKTLEEYNWPGNVRELKNTIEKMVILSDEDIISSAELWSSESSLIKDNVQLGNIQLKTILEQIELKYIREYCSLYGTLEKTAEKLDMNLKTLSRRKKHLEEKYPRSENL